MTDIKAMPLMKCVTAQSHALAVADHFSIAYWMENRCELTAGYHREEAVKRLELLLALLGLEARPIEAKQEEAA